MVFNSIEFFIFFVIVFALYYFAFKEKTKVQNVLLLVASYVFYAYANWKILPLLVATTVVFYGFGLALSEAKTDKQKSLYTLLCVVFGISTLLYFKYFNFFISSFKDLFETVGLQTNLHTFNIILPIGISFYTFRLLSYIIDIQRNKIEPTRNIIDFAAYVAFFPCILAGPIDRPATFIPQLQSKRIFDYPLAVDGMRQILWGLFKKVVVADNCVTYVNQVFDTYQTQSGSTLLLGAILFSFQVYGDFSGYSDMAIGVSKLLGFRITKNFDYPFFAQNIAEYWRKWHISLTSWLTDYIFMPLNVKWRDWGKWGMILAIIVNFVICGLWHGANWTFILWGFYHGLLFIPLILSGAMNKKNKIKTYKWGFPKFNVLFNILLTFSLVTLGNIIFRADSLIQAFEYFGRMIDTSLFNVHHLINKKLLILILFNSLLLFVVEWLQRNKQYGLDLSGIKSHFLKFAIYGVLIAIIFMFGGGAETFIYFQF